MPCNNIFWVISHNFRNLPTTIKQGSTVKATCRTVKIKTDRQIQHFYIKHDSLA